MFHDFIQSHIKPHAVIFCVTTKADIDSLLKEYIKSIVLNNLSKEDKQVYSKKIDSWQYCDIIQINGFQEAIKKEDILNIKNSFSYTGVEKTNQKFYVIYGVENITAQAANSLLKFLEEPPKNTYAIFVTKSPNSILETIKSRCQLYCVHPSEDKFNDVINRYKIKDDKLIKACETYCLINELDLDLQNKELQKNYEFVSNLSECESNLKLMKDMCDEFKKFSYSKINKILLILIKFYPNMVIELNKLQNLIKFNPNKVLFFNKILNTIK